MLKSYDLFLILYDLSEDISLILPQDINISFSVYKMGPILESGFAFHFGCSLTSCYLNLHEIFAPYCAQLCPGLEGNQGLVYTSRTHYLTPLWHPLHMNRWDSQGQDTLAGAWSSRDKCMPVALLPGPTHCMLVSGVGSICYQGWVQPWL